MNITLIGFVDDKIESTSRIVKHIKKYLRDHGHQVFSKMSENTDVLIFNLQGEKSKEWLQTRPVPRSVYKIFIVHEVSVSTAPFLKYADKLVFFNHLQQGVADRVLKCGVPSIVRRYPQPTVAHAKEKEQAIFFATDFDPEYTHSYLHMLTSWWDPTKYESTGESAEVIQHKMESEFRCYFSVSRENMDTFESFEKEVASNESIKNAVLHKSSKWRDKKLESYMAVCDYAYIWSEEIPIGTTERLIEEESIQIIYSPIKESSVLAKAEAYGCKIIVDDGASMVNEGLNRESYDEFCGTILEDIEQNAEKSIADKDKVLVGADTDVLASLNVVQGELLHNDYVFVVSFRNQESKIARCLESIIQQNRSHDFGIAVTDDCSTDGSIEIASQVLAESGVPHVLVHNLDRKYASRNLWNAGHLLITKTRSVMIEVDGDDFLADNTVLDTVVEAYKDGAMKTLGSFQTYPNKAEELVSRAHSSQSYENPWDQGKCSSWCPLRTYKVSLFRKVEKEHFLDRETGTWLTMCHDSSVNPRMIQLAKGKVMFMPEITYVYDTSGNDHDAALQEEWSPVWAYNHINGPISF